MKRDGTTVYVPVADSPLRHLILPGSGIVGTPQPGTGQVLIYFEGNKFGSEAFATYEDRCYHAWDRMTWKGRGYPTTAMSVVSIEELIEVGFLEIPGEPTDADVNAEIRHRYRTAWTVDAIRHTPEYRHICRDLQKPRLHVDRQDVVDEWLAAVTA